MVWVAFFMCAPAAWHSRFNAQPLLHVCGEQNDLGNKYWDGGVVESAAARVCRQGVCECPCPRHGSRASGRSGQSPFGNGGGWFAALPRRAAGRRHNIRAGLRAVRQRRQCVFGYSRVHLSEQEDEEGDGLRNIECSFAGWPKPRRVSAFGCASQLGNRVGVQRNPGSGTFSA